MSDLPPDDDSTEWPEPSDDPDIEPSHNPAETDAAS
jgi:hypothetical protein